MAGKTTCRLPYALLVLEFFNREWTPMHANSRRRDGDTALSRAVSDNCGIVGISEMHNPVGGAPGVQYTHRSADGIICTCAPARPIRIPAVIDLFMNRFFRSVHLNAIVLSVVFIR